MRQPQPVLIAPPSITGGSVMPPSSVPPPFGGRSWHIPSAQAWPLGQTAPEQAGTHEPPWQTSPAPQVMFWQPDETHFPVAI